MPGFRPPAGGPPPPTDDLENILGAIATCFVATGLTSWSIVRFFEVDDGVFRLFGIPFTVMFIFAMVGSTRQMIIILANYYRWRHKKPE